MAELRTLEEIRAAIRALEKRGARVPYNGANQDVDLGDHNLSADMILSDFVSIANAAHYDDLDVSGVNVIVCDSTANDIVIGGFSNGVIGQVLFITKQVTANNLIIEHNEGTGTQRIYTHNSADYTIATRGGTILVCVQLGVAAWRQVGAIG